MSVEKTPRPILGFVLSLIGGTISHIIGLFYGIVFLNMGPSGYVRFGGMNLRSDQVLLVSLWFLTVGAIVILGSFMLYERPENHRKWGVVITVFSILGGGILGVIGGTLAIVWKPTPTPSTIEKITRICPQCGRVLKEDPNVKFCPYCGNELV